MSDNLVLERLRELRGLLGEVKADTADIKHRVATLELQVGGLQASEQNHYASLSVRLDRVSADMGYIKRRLDIVDVPAD